MGRNMSISGRLFPGLIPDVPPAPPKVPLKYDRYGPIPDSGDQPTQESLTHVVRELIASQVSLTQVMAELADSIRSLAEAMGEPDMGDNPDSTVMSRKR